MSSEKKMGGLIMLVVFVLIAVVVYPLISGQIDNATNATHDDYVGSDSSDLVGMIPLFYWLSVLLCVIGFAIVAIKSAA